MTKDFTHAIDSVLDDNMTRSVSTLPYVPELERYLEEKTFEDGLYFRIERTEHKGVAKMYAYIRLNEVPRSFGESIIYPWVLKWSARCRPAAQNPEVDYGTNNNMTIYLSLTTEEEEVLSGEYADVVTEWSEFDGCPENYTPPKSLRAPLIDMARLTKLKRK